LDGRCKNKKTQQTKGAQMSLLSFETSGLAHLIKLAKTEEFKQQLTVATIKIKEIEASEEVKVPTPDPLQPVQVVDGTKTAVLDPLQPVQVGDAVQTPVPALLPQPNPGKEPKWNTFFSACRADWENTDAGLTHALKYLPGVQFTPADSGYGSIVKLFADFPNECKEAQQESSKKVVDLFNIDDPAPLEFFYPFFDECDIAELLYPEKKTKIEETRVDLRAQKTYERVAIIMQKNAMDLSFLTACQMVVKWDRKEQIFKHFATFYGDCGRLINAPNVASLAATRAVIKRIGTSSPKTKLNFEQLPVLQQIRLIINDTGCLDEEKRTLAANVPAFVARFLGYFKEFKREDWIHLMKKENQWNELQAELGPGGDSEPRRFRGELNTIASPNLSDADVLNSIKLFAERHKDFAVSAVYLHIHKSV